VASRGSRFPSRNWSNGEKPLPSHELDKETKERGNRDIIQDVSPISEARACNIVPLEIV